MTDIRWGILATGGIAHAFTADLSTAGLLPLLNVGVGIEVLGGLTIILLYMLSGIKEKKP